MKEAAHRLDAIKRLLTAEERRHSYLLYKQRCVERVLQDADDEQRREAGL